MICYNCDVTKSRGKCILMPYQNSDISAFIEKSKQGDDLAYESLLAHFMPTLEKISYKYSIPRKDTSDDHADILQEASIALYRAIQDYDQSVNVPFDKFLSMVLTCKLNDYMKYRTRNKQKVLNLAISMDKVLHSSDDGYDDITLYTFFPNKGKLNDPAEAVTEKLHHHIILETILADLTDLECKVFYLYFLEGFKISETAKILSVKGKSVDNAIRRVKFKSLKHKEFLLIA